MSGKAGLREVLQLNRKLKDTREVFGELVRRHGDVVEIRLGPTTFFLVVHPDDVEAILETNADRFQRVAGERRVSGRIVGDSVFSLEGADHAWERSMLEPVMYGRAAEVVTEPVVRLAERWRETLVHGQPIDVWASLERFATELIIWMVLGTDPHEPTGRAIVDTLLSAVATMDALPLSPTRFAGIARPVRRRFLRERAKLDELVLGVIAERRRSPGTDIVSMLLDARDDEGRAYTDLQLRNQFVALYRGHTPASTALSLTWLQLDAEPDVEAKVLAEIDAVGDRLPSFGDLGRLSYTRMTFQESFRLYPPAWVLARIAIAEHHAGGRVIRPGARVLLSEWVTHRDERFWDEPLAFRPERFTPEAEAARPRYAYYPQGGGDKMCMGKHVVVPMEAPLLLATIGQRWRFHAAPGHEPALAPRATLKPKHGIWLIPERRQ